jgi:UDP-N-acetyl-D-mannosaminuronic acid dehydrogenase
MYASVPVTERSYTMLPCSCNLEEISEMTQSVCVMGLGVVGLPTARYFQERGCKLVGYDISAKAVANARKWIEATDEPRRIPSDIDVFIICVSTKLAGDQPDASNVYDACRIISGCSPKLVSIESTVPIGTCRTIHRTILDEKASLVHVPHRYWPEDPGNYGVNQSRVVGAVDNESMTQAYDFYRRLGIPLIAVKPIEIAEMAKIVENAYRYVQIAFAEELSRICNRIHMDFNLLRDACNSKWNIDIPEARSGIGGTCLPKDIRYLITAASHGGLEADLLLSAIRTDKGYINQLPEALVRR